MLSSQQNLIDAKVGEKAQLAPLDPQESGTSFSPEEL